MQGSACSLSVRWKKSAKKWHFLSLHIKDKCDSFESSLNYFIFTVLYSYSGHQRPQQLLKSCTCQNLSIIASVTTCTVTETAAEKEEILNSLGCQNFAVETCLWWYQCHLFEQYCVRWIESNPGWAAHWTGEDSGRCHQGSLADGGERALQTSRVDAKEKEVENHTTSGSFGMLVARLVNSKKRATSCLTCSPWCKDTYVVGLHPEAATQAVGHPVSEHFEEWCIGQSHRSSQPQAASTEGWRLMCPRSFMGPCVVQVWTPGPGAGHCHHQGTSQPAAQHMCGRACCPGNGANPRQLTPVMGCWWGKWGHKLISSGCLFST